MKQLVLNYSSITAAQQIRLLNMVSHQATVPGQCYINENPGIVSYIPNWRRFLPRVSS